MNNRRPAKRPSRRNRIHKVASRRRIERHLHKLRKRRELEAYAASAYPKVTPPNPPPKPAPKKPDAPNNNPKDR